MPLTAPDLSTFDPGLNAVVVGASGGIGQAFVDQLVASPRVNHVYACSRNITGDRNKKITHLPIELLNETTIEQAAHRIHEQIGEVQLVIVATGLLHRPEQIQPEKSLRQIDAQNMQDLYQINAVGPILVAKHFLGLLSKNQKSVFAALSAKVGSIDDNQLGGWHAYRSSKAALNMLVKNGAIELARKNPNALAVTLHPGTVKTSLSAPFSKNVSAAGLFSPERSAHSLLSVINDLVPADSGYLYSWNGERIPF